MFVTKDKPPRGFVLPLDLVSAARDSGISIKQLQDMVAHSTRITHPDGNRRYKDYLFKVEGNRVTSFGKVAGLEAARGLEAPPRDLRAVRDVVVPASEPSGCPTCHGTGKVQMFDECDHCEGVGCKHCDEGLVPSSIPCQTCRASKGIAFRT